MSETEHLQVILRSQKLVQNTQGYNVWEIVDTPTTFLTSQTTLVLCDVWDKHWCRGADERLARLLPQMNRLVGTLRDKGVLIVHAPSGTMAFYTDMPARQRVLHAPEVEPPVDLSHDDPPLPVDASDGGCDTDSEVTRSTRAWTRQHSAIEIDQERDAISDDGRELYNLYHQRGIKNLFIMGVHTNMCILGRSFAIKQMVRWGFNVALVRDLTDAMYNPAKAPYVSHEEGTGLVIEYIEKFWCPTVSSEGVIDGL